MKKIFFVWLFAMVSILGYAQNLTEHMSFMGIPINGTITQFQTKLQGKGCALDRDSSYSLASNGFKGAVDLYIAKDDSFLRYPYWFNLHIDYLDAINGEKHQNQSLEDI